MTEQHEPFNPDWRVPPGDHLIEEIRARGWGADYIILNLRWTSATLLAVIVGDHPIGEWEATDLSRVFGTSKEYWLNLQKHYDEPPTTPPRYEEVKEGPGRIEPLKEWRLWLGPATLAMIVGLIVSNTLDIWWLSPPSTLGTALFLRWVMGKIEG